MPVFNQIAQPGWCLCALRHQPPQSPGVTDQVEGSDMQVALLHDAVHWTQVAGMPLDQCRGEPALLHQGLRAIDIGHHLFQQAHALLDAGGQALPLCMAEQQGEQVELPGAKFCKCVALRGVAGAVVADQALQAGVMPVQGLGAGVWQGLEKCAPGRGRAVIWSGGGQASQFVEMAFSGHGVIKRRQGPGCGTATHRERGRRGDSTVRSEGRSHGASLRAIGCEALVKALPSAHGV